MNRSESHSEIIVIYDGECAFCKECVRWLAKQVTVTALPFQSADLAQFNLTYERCSKEVVAIIDGKVLGGSSAVAALLKVSGHRTIGNVIMLSGPLGRRGYKWVASHRDGWLVRSATALLKSKNRTK